MPISHRHWRTTVRSASMLTPRAVNTSADPDFEESARLPCLATGTPQPATMSALAVEMLKLPEESPPVPQVSIVPGGASMASAFARMIRAAPVISSTVSPRTLRAIKKAPICEGEALPLMMTSNAASAWLSLRLCPCATRASSALKSGTSVMRQTCRGEQLIIASPRPNPIRKHSYNSVRHLTGTVRLSVTSIRRLTSEHQCYYVLMYAHHADDRR